MIADTSLSKMLIYGTYLSLWVLSMGPCTFPCMGGLMHGSGGNKPFLTNMSKNRVISSMIFLVFMFIIIKLTPDEQVCFHLLEGQVLLFKNV